MNSLGRLTVGDYSRMLLYIVCTLEWSSGRWSCVANSCVAGGVASTSPISGSGKSTCLGSLETHHEPGHNHDQEYSFHDIYNSIGTADHQRKFIPMPNCNPFLPSSPFRKTSGSEKFSSNLATGCAYTSPNPAARLGSPFPSSAIVE